MSGRKNSRNTTPRHVRICHYMLDSPAWKSLGAVEQALYLNIARKYAGPGSNNGKIVFSIRMAAESLHIGKTKAAVALNVLQERGFIVAMNKGAFSLKVRHASEWRLTEFQCDVTGEIAAKEFMRWGKSEP